MYKIKTPRGLRGIDTDIIRAVINLASIIPLSQNITNASRGGYMRQFKSLVFGRGRKGYII